MPNTGRYDGNATVCFRKFLAGMATTGAGTPARAGTHDFTRMASRARLLFRGGGSPSRTLCFFMFYRGDRHFYHVHETPEPAGESSYSRVLRKLAAPRVSLLDYVGSPWVKILAAWLV